MEKFVQQLAKSGSPTGLAVIHFYSKSKLMFVAVDATSPVYLRWLTSLVVLPVVANAKDVDLVLTVDDQRIRKHVSGMDSYAFRRFLSRSQRGHDFKLRMNRVIQVEIDCVLADNTQTGQKFIFPYTLSLPE